MFSENQALAGTSNEFQGKDSLISNWLRKNKSHWRRGKKQINNFPNSDQ